MASAQLEPDTKPGPVVEALAAELRALARWLELESIGVGRRGNLARRLVAAVGGRGR